MVDPTQMKQTIHAFWGGVVEGDGRISEYDLIRTLTAMGARPNEILDAIVETEHLSRGYTAAIASDLAVTLPGCGSEVASHLQQHYGLHPAAMVFGTPYDDHSKLVAALGLADLPVRWLNDGDWVKGLETLAGQPLNLVGMATWPIGTFRFYGRPDARIFLPGLDVDSGLDLKDCDLFGFSDLVDGLHLSGKIRGGAIKVVGSSVTEGPTDLSDMQLLRSSHHTHILSGGGTEAELQLPHIAPERVEFIRLAQ